MNRMEAFSSLKILLVEDNPHDQIAFQRALLTSGFPFELTMCERAEDIPSLMQAGSQAFDMIVMDYDLPGMDGLESFRGLQRLTDLPPFIMLTGTGSEYLAVDALKSGMYDYIIKDPNQGYLRLLPLKLIDVKKRHKDRLARLNAEAELKKTHVELERKVKERTVDLAQTVQALEQEIAERQCTENALRQSEKALRRLSLKLVETQENERRQLAKELHDSIGSALAAIKFAVEEKLKSMHGAPPKDIITLEKIIRHIHETIREVRRISTHLRPSMLDDLGLLATIEWYCRSSREMYPDTRIEHRLDVNEADIPEISKIVLYRVMQEALNNALRHSTADTVWISLEKAEKHIRMCVTDDGAGFDPDKAMGSNDPLTGFGLRGMHDRAEFVGGTLTIDSGPEKGTAVCLRVPAGDAWQGGSFAAVNELYAATLDDTDKAGH